MKDKRKAFALFLLPAAFTLFPAVLYGQGGQSEIETLENEIDSLESTGGFEEALLKAKKLYHAVKSNEEAERYKIDDARRKLETLEYIVSLPDSLQRRLAEGERLTDLYMSLYWDGAYQEALEKAREQLKIREEIYEKPHTEIAECMSNVGYLLTDLEMFEEAEEMYRGALAIDLEAAGKIHPNTANDYNNLGGLYHSLGKLSKADSLYRQSLNIYRELGWEGSEHEALMLGNIATVFKDRGDFAAAEPLFRKALVIYRRLYGNVDSDVAYALNNLASVLVEKRDYVQARKLYQESVSIYRQLPEDYELDLAISLVGLASVLQDQREYYEAEKLYREALSLCKEIIGGEHSYIAGIINNIADLSHDRGDYRAADSLYAQALEMSESLHGKNHKNVAIMTLNLARNKRDMEEYAAAKPLYSKSLDMFRDLLGEKHPYVAMCLYSYGNYLIARKDYERAESCLEECVEVYEVSRARAGEGIDRAAFQNSPYPKLAHVHLSLGRQKEAWSAVESDRGRVLAEFLANSGKKHFTPEEMEREDSLKRQLQDIERELDAYRKAAEDDSTGEIAEKLEGARNRLLEKEIEWSHFQTIMSGKYPLARGVALSLDAVRKSIEENTAIIGWLDTEVKKGKYVSWVYIIKKSGGVIWERCALDGTGEPGDHAEFSRNFRSQLLSPEYSAMGVKHEASRLYSFRLSRISKHLEGIEELIVIPSGPMLGLPVEALTDENGDYLCDKYTVSYSPSATIYAWLNKRKKDSPQGKSGLFVGDPPFNENHLTEETEGGETSGKRSGYGSEEQWAGVMRGVLEHEKSALSSLPRLASSRREVEEISKMAGDCSILVGKDASEETLVDYNESGKLRDLSIIHFATHALVDDENPYRSALVLSQVGLKDPVDSAIRNERIYDGLVTAGEIVNEWEVDADIVTLSACETGLGRRVGGEGYIGFSHAFFQVGARSVMVSLWKVEDRATFLLMRRFYQNYLGGGSGFEVKKDSASKRMSKAEALREAKNWLRAYISEDGVRPFEHPFYWAAFVLMGGR